MAWTLEGAQGECGISIWDAFGALVLSFQDKSANTCS